MRTGAGRRFLPTFAEERDIGHGDVPARLDKASGRCRATPVESRASKTSLSRYPWGGRLAAGKNKRAQNRRSGESVMRDAYHEELNSINDGLVDMARLVSSAIGRATTALRDADL